MCRKETFPKQGRKLGASYYESNWSGQPHKNNKNRQHEKRDAEKDELKVGLLYTVSPTFCTVKIKYKSYKITTQKRFRQTIIECA